MQGDEKVEKVNRSYLGVVVLSVVILALSTLVALAAPGDLLGTVNLPGNGNCAVAGTFDGTYYMTMQGGFGVGCAGSTLQVFLPPAGGNGNATLVSTKSIVDGGGSPVSISALAWDPSRSSSGNEMVWGAFANRVFLINIGDPTVSGNALATTQFAHNLSGGLIDGLAWDPNDDTLYWSRDATCCVWQFSLGTGVNPPLGTLMNTVTSKNAAGQADGLVSGVVVGAGNTLYIGRDGAAEIRRIDKTTGDFISQFATTAGRVEDLTCDPITYAPNEAILAKDAYTALYEAFEVEPGTCPLPGEVGGRMTGGGSVLGSRVTHGFELHCDVNQAPNNLEVNWGKGDKFHLESLDTAACSDDPNIDERPPVAGFDTYVGTGTGRYNGESGATIEFTFTDAGEPGKNDDATIKITDAGGNEVLSVSGKLKNGNHQAHPD